VSNKRLKIYYATQVDSQPPTIVLFVNDPAIIQPTYKRYLLGVFRDNLPFGEVPIKLYLRKREEQKYSAAEMEQPELRDMIEMDEGWEEGLEAGAPADQMNPSAAGDEDEE
jgi:GTP-binding protein